MKNQRRIIGLVSFSLVLGLAIVGAASTIRQKNNSIATQQLTPPPSVCFSSSPDTTPFRSTFSAPQFIYAHLHFPVPMKGTHRLEGDWVTPSGRSQEHARVTLHFPDAGGDAAYLWLRFNEPSSGGGMSTLIGDEPTQNDFNGVWTLEATWDGEVIARSTFSVTNAGALERG